MPQKDCTKEELKLAIQDVTDKKMSQSDFLKFCIEHEDAVLRHCDSKMERKAVKTALRMGKVFFKA